MSHETSNEHSRESSADRLWRIKRLTDHLISLAPFVDEPRIEDEAKAIIEEIKLESTPPVAQLGKLEELAVLSSRHPENPQLHSLINDSAEYLLEEIKDHHADSLLNSLGLSHVWAPIKAWDATRSPATAKLCVTVLDNYRGEGQAHLARAFIMANEKQIDFDTALDSINEEAA
jgi:hypothetical protein